MIVDKIGQPIDVGDWVASAQAGYGGSAPHIVVGIIVKITEKGNVSLKPMSFHMGKLMNAVSHSQPAMRMLKLTGPQLDQVDKLLTEIMVKRDAVTT
jgi:hypothetical protein